jgi:hypothetical protein
MKGSQTNVKEEDDTLVVLGQGNIITEEKEMDRIESNSWTFTVYY